MTPLPVNSAQLLAELQALPAANRVDRLRAAGPPDRLLMDLGDEAERSALSRVADALDATAMIIELSTTTGTPRARARAMRARSHALACAGRFDEAMEAARGGRDEALRAGENIEAGRLLLAMLQPLTKLGRFDEAISIGLDARRELAAAGAEHLAARADLNLGNILKGRGQPQAALEHLERARAGLIDEPLMVAHIENTRGESLLELNRFADAERAFDAALETFSARGDRFACAIVEGNTADLAARQGRLQDALSRFESARRWLEGDAAAGHRARMIVEQADAIEMLGLAEDALEAYSAAMPELERHGLAVEYARAQAGFGRTLLRLGRVEEAAFALARAARRFDALGDPGAAAAVELHCAQAMIGEGALDDAERLLVDASARLTGQPVHRAAAAVTLANVRIQKGDHVSAGATLAEAVEEIERLGVAPLLEATLHARSRIHRAQGRLPEAIADLRRAVAQTERVRATLQAERHRVAYLGRRTMLYEELVTALLDHGGESAVRDAFEVVEQAKSRALLDMVRQSLDLTRARLETVESLDPSERLLLDRLAALRAELNVFYSLPDDPEQPGNRSVGGISWQAAIRQRERDIDRLESRLRTAHGAAGLLAPPLPIDDARRAVSAETRLVEYFVAGSEVLAFVIDPDDECVFRRLCSASELRDLCDRIRFQVSRALRRRSDLESPALLKQAKRELNRVWSVLVAPIERTMGSAERVVFVPHGGLHAVPLHAAFDGTRFLVERTDVSYAPSASVLAGDVRPPGASGAPLVVGVADEFAPGIDAEARRIGELLQGATVLLGADATVDRVAAAMRDASVIHMACHGRFAPRTPMAAGLRLGDRWMTVRDLYDLRCRAALVTLSACETGRQRIASGDELVGLARALLGAGAESVMVSLWTADDTATEALMRRFYQTWDEGRANISRAHALRDAQCSILSQFPHPAAWAPFVLMGRAT